jgi:hypothetical protein
MNTQKRIFHYLVSAMLSILFILMVGLSIPNTASAATYYVAKTGSDGNTCVQAKNTGTPKLTIAAGISCMSTADTLYIRAGTYTESIHDRDFSSFPRGTSWSNAPVISAYPGEKVTWVGIFGFHQATTAYVIVKDIIFDGTRTLNQLIYGTCATSHVRFQNIEVKNSISIGIFLAGSAAYCEDTSRPTYYEIINSTIHDNGSMGIYMSTSNNLVDHSTFYNNDWVEKVWACYGIQIFNGNPDCYTNNNTIRNSLFYGNGGNPNHPSSGAIWASSGTGNLIYNNIVYDNNFGLTLTGLSLEVYNNTIYNNNYNGIYIKPGSHTGMKIQNNISYGNTLAGIKNDGTDVVLSNNLTSDPLFVNAAGYDFHLKSNSPAINAGYKLSSVVTTDYSGTSRPQGAAFDIGAFESTSSTPTATPAPKNLRVDETP